MVVVHPSTDKIVLLVKQEQIVTADSMTVKMVQTGSRRAGRAMEAFLAVVVLRSAEAKTSVQFERCIWEMWVGKGVEDLFCGRDRRTAI